MRGAANIGGNTMNILAIALAGCTAPKVSVEEVGVIEVTENDTDSGDTGFDDTGVVDTDVTPPDDDVPIDTDGEDTNDEVEVPTDESRRRDVLKACEYPEIAVSPIETPTGTYYVEGLDLHGRGMASFEAALSADFLQPGQTVEDFYDGAYPFTVYSGVEGQEGLLQITLGDNRGLYSGDSRSLEPGEVKLPVLFCRSYADAYPASTYETDLIVGELKVDDEGISEKWPGENSFSLGVVNHATPDEGAESPIIYSFSVFTGGGGGVEAFFCNRVGGLHSDCDLEDVSSAMDADHAEFMGVVEGLGDGSLNYY